MTTRASVRTCCQVLRQEIARAPGIDSFQLDPEHGNLIVRYRNEDVSPDQVNEIAARLRPVLERNLTACPVADDATKREWCKSCAQLADRECADFEVRAGALQGLIYVGPDQTSRVERPPRVESPPPDHGDAAGTVTGPHATADLAELHVSLTVGGAAPERRSLLQQLSDTWTRFTELPWEAILTGATFVLMFAAMAAERLLQAHTLSIVLYVLAYVTGGIFGVRAGLASALSGTIDVDLLMVLAALGAAIVGAPFEGVLLLFLFSLSNVLQDYAMGRTRHAIRALMQLRPARASVLRGGQEVVLPVESCRVGDIFVVRPGEKIALDGTVVDGASAVDQAVITGESRPVKKEINDSVLAGTMNKNGVLRVQVTKTAKDSTLAKIIRLVEEAQGQKAKTQRFLDKAEQYYATGVIIATVLAIVIPVFIIGEGFDSAFYRAMTLMVAASPCALIISTPASILSGIGNGARRGILFKGGVHLEQAAGIRVVAFDKTGTLTLGQPRVSDVIVMDQAARDHSSAAEPAIASTNGDLWQGDNEDLLALVATVESNSEHLLAKATVEEAKRRNIAVSESLAFEAVSGRGVRASVDDKTILIGNSAFIRESAPANLDAAGAHLERLEAENKTVVLVAQVFGSGEVVILGIVAFSDQLRPEASEVVADLKNLGVQHIVMLTGDNAETAEHIGREVGVDEVYSELMPDQKLSVIEELEEKYGPVAMIGDGVNDAPALARASLGVAMGAAGTDVAMETADVVLMADELPKVAYVMALSRRTRRTLIFNLGLAGLLIAVMIVGIFAVSLPLPLAVVGHEGGTVLVSLNGLRLLFFKRRNHRPAAVS